MTGKRPVKYESWPQVCLLYMKQRNQNRETFKFPLQTLGNGCGELFLEYALQNLQCFHKYRSTYLVNSSGAINDSETYMAIHEQG